ncbi:MAG: tetratricopeptide repeat protein [Desulfosudaceae bacterium]
MTMAGMLPNRDDHQALRPWHSWASALTVIIGLVFILYSNSLDTPFVLDDLPHILENPHIRMTEISADRISDIFRSPSSNRPAANISFAANYYFHRYQMSGYHLVNLLIHALTAFLLFLLARQTLRLCRAENSWTALLAALLWLANPVQTQTVTYIVQRMTSLATLFYLLSLICYIQARLNQKLPEKNKTGTSVLFTAAAVSGLFSLASKEIAATLPISIYLYEWFFLRKRGQIPLKKYFKWADLVLVALTLTALLYCDGHVIDKIASSYQKAPFSLSQRLLTQPAVVIYYISLILFPHPDRLHLIYDFPLTGESGQPAAAALAIAALMALLGAAVHAARKHRLIAFAILWFLVTLSIESSMVGLAMAFEHRLYLPSTFPCIAVAWAIVRHILPGGLNSRKILYPALMLILIGMWGGWTHQRNTVWQTRVGLWRDNAAKAPLSEIPHGNLGFALLHEGRNQEAITVLDRALRINPFYEKSHNNMALACFRTNDQDRALAHCRRSLAIDPDNNDSWNMMGYILYGQGKDQEARKYLTRVPETSPAYFKARLQLGIIHLKAGRYHEASESFTAVIEQDPACRQAWYYLGRCRFRTGHRVDARNCFQRALTISPHYHQAHQGMADVMLRDKKYGRAITHYQKVLAARPDNLSASINLAKARKLKGQTGRAVKTLETALRQTPGNPALLLSLGLLHAESGHLTVATGYLEQLSILMPDNARIYYNLACLYARRNKIPSAAAALRKAIDNGYDRWQHLQSDKDLENLRRTDYYVEVLQTELD